MLTGGSGLTLHRTRSIKIKQSYKVIFETLFNVFEKNKNTFTVSLMENSGIDENSLARFESINDFFMYLKDNLEKELKTSSIEKIKSYILNNGRMKSLELLVKDKYFVRENISFRVPAKEIDKVKEMKEKYNLFPLGLVVEMMIDLFISKLPLHEYELIENALKTLDQAH